MVWEVKSSTGQGREDRVSWLRLGKVKVPQCNDVRAVAMRTLPSIVGPPCNGERLQAPAIHGDGRVRSEVQVDIYEQKLKGSSSKRRQVGIAIKTVEHLCDPWQLDMPGLAGRDGDLSNLLSQGHLRGVIDEGEPFIVSGLV